MQISRIWLKQHTFSHKIRSKQYFEQDCTIRLHINTFKHNKEWFAWFSWDFKVSEIREKELANCFILVNSSLPRQIKITNHKSQKFYKSQIKITLLNNRKHQDFWLTKKSQLQPWWGLSLAYHTRFLQASTKPKCLKNQPRSSIFTL